MDGVQELEIRYQRRKSLGLVGPSVLAIVAGLGGSLSVLIAVGAVFAGQIIGGALFGLLAVMFGIWWTLEHIRRSLERIQDSA